MAKPHDDGASKQRIEELGRTARAIAIYLDMHEPTLRRRASLLSTAFLWLAAMVLSGGLIAHFAYAEQISWGTLALVAGPALVAVLVFWGLLYRFERARLFPRRVVRHFRHDLDAEGITLGDDAIALALRLAVPSGDGRSAVVQALETAFPSCRLENVVPLLDADDDELASMARRRLEASDDDTLPSLIATHWEAVLRSFLDRPARTKPGIELLATARWDEQMARRALDTAADHLASNPALVHLMLFVVEHTSLGKDLLVVGRVGRAVVEAGSSPAPPAAQAVRKLLDTAQAELAELRCDALGRVTDPSLLAHVSRNDRLPKLRMLAVERLDDAALLAHIAQNDPNTKVRLTAVARIRDEALLERLVLEDEHMAIRTHALEGIRDQVRLVRLCSAPDDPDLCLAALSRINDPAQLVAVLMQGGPSTVLEQAMSQVERQQDLITIALRVPSEGLQLAAIEKLEDQQTLARVARTAHSEKNRLAALYRLRDPTAIAALAREAESDELRGAALERCQDQALLAEFARSESSANLRRILVQRVFDKALLASMAQGDEDQKVRAEAAAKVDDQRVLAAIAVGDKATRVRLAATERLEDQVTLVCVAREDKVSAVREAAVDRLNDQPTLVDIARTDISMPVRRKAVVRIEDPAVLAGLVLKDDDEKVRALLVQRLEDQAVLELLAQEDNCATVRQLALGKVESQEFLVAAAQNLSRQAEAVEAIRRVRSRSVLEGLAKRCPAHPVKQAVQNRLKKLKEIDELDRAEVVARGPGSVDDRRSALQRLGYQRPQVLAEVARADGDETVRRAALEALGGEWLSDEQCVLLADLAQTLPEPELRLVPLRKLQDQALLGELARRGEPAVIRRAAIETLSRFACQVTLAEAAAQDPDASVREAALAKLDDVAALSRLEDSLREGEARSALSERLQILGGLPYALQQLDSADSAALRDVIAELPAFAHQATLARLARHDDAQVRSAAASKLWDFLTLSELKRTERIPQVRSALAVQLERLDSWQSAYHKLMKLSIDSEGSSYSYSLEDACERVAESWGGSLTKYSEDLDTDYDSGRKGYGEGYLQIVRVGPRAFVTRSGKNWKWLD
jgi:hypothetical protein